MRELPEDLQRRTRIPNGGDPLQHECLVEVRLVHEPRDVHQTLSAGGRYQRSRPAFYWRHKILTELRQLPKPTLTGIVEADETFFLYSQKGSRHLTRAARYSGGKAALRGISHYQVCVLVARDRQEGTVSEVTGFGHVAAKQLQGALNGYLQNCILCIDAASAYGAFTRANNIPLQILNARRGVHKHGIYHLNNVNAYHSRLKQWLRPFNGVSTKYLPNYLVWFQRYDSMRNVPWSVVANGFLDC